MGLLAVLSLAVTIGPEQVVLLQSCDAAADQLATLRTGAPVEIRFAVMGELGACYKVRALSQTRFVEGYIPTGAVVGSEEFEQGRASARSVIETAAAAVRPPSAQAAVPLTGDPASKAAQLLRQDQPAEALEILERALGGNRRNPLLLAMAGSAAWRSDRAQDAVRYWTESLEIAPDRQVERMLRQAEREVAADRSSQRLVGIRFTFRYDDRSISPEQARSLVQVLDGEYARVSQELGCRLEERMTTVIQSREDYLKATGPAEWSGGFYDGRIRLALLEPVPGNLTRETIAHEVVHACLARLGQWPAWVHEGLAQKISGRTLGSGERALIQKMAQAKQLPSLSNMSQSFSRLSADHARAAYGMALAAAELLYAHYGTEGVRSLLQSPERLPQIAADLDRRLRQ